MRRWVVPRFGGPEVLELIEEEVPEPGPGEARVRVLAAGVAFADLQMREGTYPGGPRPPFTPGYDVVGTVDALGPGASGLARGDLVAGLPVHGGYADAICLPASELVPVPEGLDPAEAVCLVLNYVTAWQLLHRLAKAQRGERVLVHSAAGGAGTALLDLARDAGLRAYGTVSRAKHGLVERMGATPIDYRSEDFVQRLREEDGGGVDMVLDGVGGGTSLRSYRVLRRGGRLVIFGLQVAAVGGRRSTRGLFAFYAVTGATLASNLTPGGRRVFTYRIAKLKQRHPDWFREDLTRVLGMLAAREISPVVSARLPLTEAREAQEALGRGEAMGKLVLCPSQVPQ